MADRQLTTDMIDFFLGFAKNLMESGISEYARGELALLGYLYFEHDGATPGELSIKLEVGTGRIANALKNMEKKGLLIRCPKIEDKRSVGVYITDAGKEIVEDRKQIVFERVSAMLDKLGPKDAAELIRIVKKLLP